MSSTHSPHDFDDWCPSNPVQAPFEFLRQKFKHEESPKKPSLTQQRSMESTVRTLIACLIAWILGFHSTHLLIEHTPSERKLTRKQKPSCLFGMLDCGGPRDAVRGGAAAEDLRRRPRTLLLHGTSALKCLTTKYYPDAENHFSRTIGICSFSLRRDGARDLA